MRIGIDFDNTLAGYDRVFVAAARSAGLVPADFVGGKRAVRDVVMARPDGATEWMRLQGKVYGALMPDAELIDGVSDFLVHCRDVGVAVHVISHKTEFGHYDESRVNLRDAARAWMERKGFFDPGRFGIPRSNIYFEGSRADKIARIAQIGCSDFVDDLEEVFLEPTFPPYVNRWLFLNGSALSTQGPYKAFLRWQDLTSILFP